MKESEERVSSSSSLGDSPGSLTCNRTATLGSGFLSSGSVVVGGKITTSVPPEEVHHVMRTSFEKGKVEIKRKSNIVFCKITKKMQVINGTRQFLC